MDISGKTRLFGLIGSPVEHSKSPAMYNYCFDKWKLDYKYLAFDVDKNQTSDAIQAFRTFQMKGANITMPCKQEVLKYLDEISPAARLVGACNTIVNHDGVLTGYITDGEGYIENLRHEGVEVKGKKITLLGAGGVSSAIQAQALLAAQERLPFSIRRMPSGRRRLRRRRHIRRPFLLRKSRYTIWTMPKGWQRKSAQAISFPMPQGLGCTPWRISASSQTTPCSARSW